MPSTFAMLFCYQLFFQIRNDIPVTVAATLMINPCTAYRYIQQLISHKIVSLLLFTGQNVVGLCRSCSWRLGCPEWCKQCGETFRRSLISYFSPFCILQVGQAVIQIARTMGVKTANVVRDRLVGHFLFTRPARS